MVWPFKKKSKQSDGPTVEKLLERIEVLEENQDAIIEHLGEVATYCDKCHGLDGACFKCNGEGIVRRKQLFSWPFI